MKHNIKLLKIFIGIFLIGLIGAPAACAEKYTCVSVWNLPGQSTGSLDVYYPASGYNMPSGVAVATSGNIYVSDRLGDSVAKLDANGNVIKKWGSSGNGAGQFKRPEDVAVDSKENVYVVDSGNCRVQVFDSDGNFVSILTSMGSGEGQFQNYPRSIAIDSSDNVYVAGDSPDGIKKYDSTGKFVAEFGMGAVDIPIYDANGIAVDHDGYIYIIDGEGCCVHKLTPSGAYVRDFGTGGGFNPINGKLGGPTGVAVDAKGNVYVADNYYLDSSYTTYGSRINEYDKNGKFVAQWGSYGNSLGQFCGTKGITIDSSGNIYLVDAGNNRLLKFANNVKKTNK